MMKPTKTLASLFAAVLVLPLMAMPKEKKPPEPPKPIGWLYVNDGPREFSGTSFDFHKVTRKIPHGSLLPVFKTKEKDGATYGKVASLNLENGYSELGWVRLDPTELKPPQAFPLEDDLLPLLGDPYLDDVAAKHTEMARLLVHQAEGGDLLLCYLLTGQLMLAKLVVFVPSQGKFTPGASVNIPMAEALNGITSIETRDLLGDGNDCIISKENFRNLTDTSGSNLLIRRIVGGQFQTLWQAPIKFTNLSQYNPKLQILQPPEMNIGAPGTVTTGEVTYRPEGNGQTPVWKGKVDFFIINREKPLDSVSIEKACPWNGTGFAPLR
jgi:hypothetical protein